MDFNITRLLPPKHLSPIAFAALLILFGTGCGKPAAPKSEYRMGDLATAGPLTYNVLETQWRSQLDAFPTSRIPDRNYLLVRVTVTNSGGSEASIPLLKLENSHGDVFPESDNGAGVDNWMGLLRRLPPAQSADGWLLFDVPTNSYRLRVSDGALENEHVAFVGIPLNLQQ